MPSKPSIPRVCEQCGISFFAHARVVRRGEGRFCSRDCVTAFAIGKPRHIPYERHLARFWSKVNKTETCWLWMASLRSTGYGQFYWPGRGVTGAHRLSYELAYGPIPEGMFVLHRCDVRTCVRPDHLFLGTAADNIHDMYQKGRAKPPKFKRQPTADERARGERSGRAKVSASQVRSMRQRHAQGMSTIRELADEYGIHLSQIARIIRRDSWEHVD